MQRISVCLVDHPDGEDLLPSKAGGSPCLLFCDLCNVDEYCMSCGEDDMVDEGGVVILLVVQAQYMSSKVFVIAIQAWLKGTSARCKCCWK